MRLKAPLPLLVLTTLLVPGMPPQAAAQFTSRILEARRQSPEPPTRGVDVRTSRLNLALTDYHDGDFFQAASEFASLLRVEPGNVRIATLLGDCDMHLGRNAQAISLLAPLEKTSPDNLNLEWTLGSALIRAGRAQDGLERIEKVARQGHSAEAYVLAARVYLIFNKFDRARRDLEAARQLSPGLRGLETLSGMIMEYAGNPKGAQAAFEKAIEANPGDFEAQMRLGALEYSERRIGPAKLHIERALEINPNSPLARFEQARIENAQGDVGAAVGDLAKVARDDPGWLPPHVMLTALYYRLKLPKEGAREKKIVDQLIANHQQRQRRSPAVNPTALPP